MADNYATRDTINYSGLLFNKGNTRTPLTTMLARHRKTTNHVEFVTGQEYTTGLTGAQPAISEETSLTAPDVTTVGREQKTNVTQIFHESVGVTYAKMSDMGTLGGVNIAGQKANPMNELDFQTAAKMQKIGRDIEYTVVRGVYAKAASKTQANKTRGFDSAITTNVVPMGGKPLGLWGIAEALKAIYDSNAPTNGLVLFADVTTMYQVNADAQNNNLTIVPADRTVNGIQLASVLTPIGKVFLQLGEFLPAGTAHLLNLDVCGLVEQPTPGKGNFFRELLAKAGAGEKYQIFGQIGLDHGPEWYHAKLTGISTEFTAPAGRPVYLVNSGE